ncbi:MAG: PfkB family carbohydrate kinase [Opitutus sp.]
MTPSALPDIICIGSVLWDYIGRSDRSTSRGADEPGRITRVPGGVAMNIAMTMRRFGMKSTLLTAIGNDPAGEELLEMAEELGIDVEHVFRSPALPTDRYLAIEDADGLVSAVADARTLEAAGNKILEPLLDGRLGSEQRPWTGLIAVDGNLTQALLSHIATSPLLAHADLRVAPASPGKVDRLKPLLTHPRVTLYANLAEATLLCGRAVDTAPAAAEALLDLGAQRILVTDGARDCADGLFREGVLVARPRTVQVKRVTGAGDTFMGAHIFAERNGATRADALAAAIRVAADYVGGEIGS